MKNMGIDKIITEEIQNFLSESQIMSDERFKFKQRLNNSSFINYDNFTNDFDSDIAGSDIVVTWSISFWVNQMGIENFIVDIEKLEGVFNLELFDKHTDEKKQETPKNISEFEWKFIIDNAALIKGRSLYISALDFDFKNKTCNVTF